MKIKDDQISILTEHNTLYKRRIKELTRKMKALQQLVVKQELSDHAESRPSDAYYSTQSHGRPSTADASAVSQGTADVDRPMMNSAAAAAGLYSEAGPAEPLPPSNKTPERAQPAPPVHPPNSDAKSRDRDRERRRAEKSSNRRDVSSTDTGRRTPQEDHPSSTASRSSAHYGIEPPAVMAQAQAQNEHMQPVHSLTAPNRPPQTVLRGQSVPYMSLGERNRPSYTVLKCPGAS